MEAAVLEKKLQNLLSTSELFSLAQAERLRCLLDRGHFNCVQAVLDSLTIESEFDNVESKDRRSPKVASPRSRFRKGSDFVTSYFSPRTKYLVESLDEKGRAILLRATEIAETQLSSTGFLSYRQAKQDLVSQFGLAHINAVKEHIQRLFERKQRKYLLLEKKKIEKMAAKRWEEYRQTVTQDSLFDNNYFASKSFGRVSSSKNEEEESPQHHEQREKFVERANSSVWRQTEEKQVSCALLKTKELGTCCFFNEWKQKAQNSQMPRKSNLFQTTFQALVALFSCPSHYTKKIVQYSANKHLTIAQNNSIKIKDEEVITTTQSKSNETAKSSFVTHVENFTRDMIEKKTLSSSLEPEQIRKAFEMSFGIATISQRAKAEIEQTIQRVLCLIKIETRNKAIPEKEEGHFITSPLYDHDQNDKQIGNVIKAGPLCRITNHRAFTTVQACWCQLIGSHLVVRSIAPSNHVPVTRCKIGMCELLLRPSVLEMEFIEAVTDSTNLAVRTLQLGFANEKEFSSWLKCFVSSSSSPSISLEKTDIVEILVAREMERERRRGNDDEKNERQIIEMREDFKNIHTKHAPLLRTKKKYEKNVSQTNPSAPPELKIPTPKRSITPRTPGRWLRFSKPTSWHIRKQIGDAVYRSVQLEKNNSKEKFSAPLQLNDFQAVRHFHVPNRVSVYDYAPAVFARLRQAYGISNSQFLKSFLPSLTGSGDSAGKSKSLLFYTTDHKYTIKTLQSFELSMLRESLVDGANMIESYFVHLMESQGESFLTRICALLEIRTVESSTGHFIALVMKNVLAPIFREIQSKNQNIRIYDLKGSIRNRHVSSDKLGFPPV
eukprot:g226.t1